MEWILGEFICKQALIKKNGRKPVLSILALNGYKPVKCSVSFKKMIDFDSLIFSRFD